VVRRCGDGGECEARLLLRELGMRLGLLVQLTEPARHRNSPDAIVAQSFLRGLGESITRIEGGSR
jgi:hypothetical protein